MTNVQILNLDPRPEGRRTLSFEQTPDWAVFDSHGRRIEFASPSSGGRITVITKCRFKPNHVKVCTDSTGRQHEQRQREITLADGRREVIFYRDSHIEHRRVIRLDEQGRTIASLNYHGNRVASEDTRQFTGEGESTTSKVYDLRGHVVLNSRTLMADDESRIDRWAYDSAGHLVWHIAISAEGEVLSSWYEIGYKSTQSASDSLGICGPRLCVSYKFDERGSGRLEKIVQHNPGEDHFEPDSEEHFDFDGRLDEKVQIKYERDVHGNWISRTVSVWDPVTKQTTEVERDSRTIKYY